MKARIIAILDQLNKEYRPQNRGMLPDEKRSVPEVREHHNPSVTTSLGTRRPFAVGLLLFLSNTTQAMECHPVAEHHRPQYIIGYGSLLEEHSKKQTDPTAGSNIPVKVFGFQRAWIVKHGAAKHGITYLGVVLDRFSHFNGAVFKVSFENLKKYDYREALYCRVEVLPRQIQRLTSIKWLENAQFWIYIPRKNNQASPTLNFPIMQSYVDIFLSGCLELEDRFKLKHYAKTCVSTTIHWSEYCVNDRLYPRRPSAYPPDIMRIDQLLH